MTTDRLARRPVVTVAAGAALISLAPVLVKLATAAGVGPSAIGAWRSLIGSALLFMLAGLRGADLRPTRREAAIFFAAGLLFAGDLFCWHRSITIVGAGMATILGNTQVFWTSAFGRLAYGEPLSSRFAIATATAFAGVVLLAGVGSEVAFTNTYLAGIGFGLATGVLYASYILTVQRSSGGGKVAPSSAAARADPLTHSLRLLAWITLATGSLLMLSTLVEGEAIAPPSITAWAYLAALAVIAQVLGWIFITAGLRHAPASRAGLALLLQPVLATIWGVAFFAESISGVQGVGAALTITAIYLGNRK